MAHNKIHERNQKVERSIRNADPKTRGGGGAYPSTMDRTFEEKAAALKKADREYERKYGSSKRGGKSNVQKARERGVGGKGQRYI